METIKNPDQLKNLETVVNFYRYLLKQPEHTHKDIVVDFLDSCLNRELLFASVGFSQTELIIYRQRLMDFINS
jgi:hypothetical protein